MLPIFENTNVKIILYASKVLFKKYPAVFYPFYMYSIYKYFLKMGRKFKIRTVPDDLIFYILNRYSTGCQDPNTTVIVSRDFAAPVGLGDFARIKGDLVKKTVQVFAFDIPDDVIYISDTLRFNLNKINLREPVTLSSLHPASIKTAKEVEICLINSGHDITNRMCDVLLKEYFRSPKLVQRSMIIAVNLKRYAPEFTYANYKTNSVEYVHFKYLKIKCEDDEDCAGDYFCVKGETELKQSAHAHGYVPAKFERFLECKFENDRLEAAVINKCPFGLENTLDSLRRAVSPFLKRRQIKLKPVFLMQGAKGNAKNLLASILAEEFGLNIHKISSYDVSATAVSQMEIKIKNAFFKAKLCAPCLFVINNFENFGKNHEGKFNERVVDYFKFELSNNLTNNDPPIIVVCISNSKEIALELGRIFLETFEFGAPNQLERAKILEWLLQRQTLRSMVNIEEIAAKTHGFFYGDLEALIYHAAKNRLVDRNGESQITMDDFDAALDTMQANYSESMGAPRVPRVQWSDVGGLGDVKAEIIRTINLPLKHPELLKGSGLRRSGILLYGPPGTGKTLLAKAVATECDLCFLSVKGPELLNMYVGQSEQNVREVFDRAREVSPCIIFFDELDSLAPNRGISGDSGGVMDRVVSQLLAEMDGLNKEATVFIIGATNRPDLIDPALLRPGRFDKLLYVGPAETHDAKLSVLQALTRKFKLTGNTNLDEIVRMCPENISGADFYGLCSGAWMSAARHLIEKIERGELNKDDVSHENVIVDTENFVDALKSIKTSINPEDMSYFKQLKQEFSTAV